VEKKQHAGSFHTDRIQEKVMQNEFDKASKEQLIADFRTVVADAEALLKATVNQGGDELAAVRSKAEESIKAMKAKMADEQAAVLALSKDAAKAADEYVHLYPWTAVGVAAGIGLLVGLLSSRR
jgi:ElaB/YqjD/DUF883 family membrane-anchored ribosome-binding protein